MKSILIVDDSPTTRRMVMASLRGLTNIDIPEAGNGLEAIERLALKPVDLMVRDRNMHGIDVLQFLRQHQPYATLPVIVLTTKGDHESRTLALHAGAARYLTEPFDSGTLATH